ncbi:hypothetical protein NMY22_g11149 [Coprinellus aureogranulatus]|nr:hypothetical protein NMY22_g11149 [Coprinellus aureogranulatus]
MRETAPSPHSGRSSPHTHQRQQFYEQPHPSSRGASPQSFQNRPLTVTSQDADANSTYGGHTIIHNEEDSPFAAITEDLRNRIIDWKGHPLSDLGPLQMYDLLSVRRDSAIREFYVYLFKEAIICVVEEKKRGLTRLLGNAGDTSSMASVTGQSKGVLRLKGRIYVRHIKHVTASSAAGEMSLTIDMEDELASFILIFKERTSMDAWKNNIQALVALSQRESGMIPQPPPAQPLQQRERALDIEEFGGSAKAMRMLSGSTHTSVSTMDSLLNPSSRSTVSSSTSHHGSLMAQQHGGRQLQHKLSTLGEEEDVGDTIDPGRYDYRTPSAHSPAPYAVTPHTANALSNSLAPLPHAPMDLILVISLPPPTAVPSTAQLKIRVIKATLDFIVASLGKKDRLSLVTFEVGQGGRVRKTPFLLAGKDVSRRRLEKFVDEIGVRLDEGQDEFLVRGSKDEKTDVVTAVNHGLDVVLQRKSRNPISGLILVSDASDSTRRAQMDLVLARAEAANVPIHSFGYGRSHDPASLWLMSNHTSGTYTFVKDWYDLRSCIAGCVGGMMSIGLINMKLHMKIVDGYRFRIRKVSGGPSSILASDGQNVDVDIGELRYGERKEMLIELELDNTDAQKMAALARQQQGNGGGRNGRGMDATDRFVQSLGLDSLAIDDSADMLDGMMDRMIDEVPVVEVDKGKRAGTGGEQGGVRVVDSEPSLLKDADGSPTPALDLSPSASTPDPPPPSSSSLTSADPLPNPNHNPPKKKKRRNATSTSLSNAKGTRDALERERLKLERAKMHGVLPETEEEFEGFQGSGGGGSASRSRSSGRRERRSTVSTPSPLRTLEGDGEEFGEYVSVSRRTEIPHPLPTPHTPSSHEQGQEEGEDEDEVDLDGGGVLAKPARMSYAEKRGASRSGGSRSDQLERRSAGRSAGEGGSGSGSGYGEHRRGLSHSTSPSSRGVREGREGVVQPSPLGHSGVPSPLGLGPSSSSSTPSPLTHSGLPSPLGFGASHSTQNLLTSPSLTNEPAKKKTKKRVRRVRDGGVHVEQGVGGFFDAEDFASAPIPTSPPPPSHLPRSTTGEGKMGRGRGSRSVVGRGEDQKDGKGGRERRRGEGRGEGGRGAGFPSTGFGTRKVGERGKERDAVRFLSGGGL